MTLAASRTAQTHGPCAGNLWTMRSRLFTTAALAATALAALPAASHAADLCVGAAPGCSGTTFDFTASGLQSAINAAGMDPNSQDRVMLAAGTLTTSATISANGIGKASIVGAGRNLTTISGSGPDSVIFNVGSSAYAGTVVSDLTMKLTATSAPQTILLFANATVERVSLLEESASSNVIAASMTGGALKHATIKTNSTSDTGVVLHSLAGDVQDSVIEAGYGVRTSSIGTHTVQRTRMTVNGIGAMIDGGTLHIRDSIIDLGGTPGGTGVLAVNQNNGSLAITTNVVRSTVVGSGANQKGLIYGADSPNEVGTGTLVDSVVSLTGASSVDVRCKQANAGTATLATTNSAYLTTDFTGTCMPTQAGRLTTPAAGLKFVDRAAGDFRLLVDSPLVDAGSTSPGAGETADALGQTRVVDGDGNGTAKVDIGGAEYQLPAPQPQVDPQPQDQSQTLPDPSEPQPEAQPQGGPAQPAGPQQQPGAGTKVVPTVTLRTAPKSAFARGASGFTLAKKASRRTIALSAAGADALELTLAKRSGKKTVQVKGSAKLAIKADGTVNVGFGGTFARKRLTAGAYRLTVTPLRGAQRGTPITVAIRVGR